MFKQLMLALCVCTGLIAGCRSTHLPSSSSPSSPVILAFYADTALTLNEFEQRYARSVGGRAEAADDSMAAYRDFLARYVNYRLKVRAMRQAGLDQDSAFQQEVRDYRLRMARPRLMCRRVLDPIIHTLHERRQEEVDVSHILIRVPPNAPPKDTLAAYHRIAALIDSLEQGADFGQLAEQYSQDPSAQQKGAPGYRGHLGYLTAGRTVKPFEDHMYQTPVGELSPIIRTRFGYHVLKVHDRRPRRPDIRVSHIMIRPQGRTAQDSAEARHLTQTLRDSIQQGTPFAALARRHSDDRPSAQKGGDLGFIRSGQSLPPAFKAAAFDLRDIGSVSDVVETRYGFHLIKLTDRKTLPTYEEAYEDLKKLATRLPRSDSAERALALDIRHRYGLTVDTTALRQALPGGLDAPVQTLHPDSLTPATAHRSVARLGDTHYTLGDLARFATENATSNSQQAIGALLDDFLNDAALDYGAARLEKRDDEFHLLMQEYREGLLIFQFMQDSVWNAAAHATDSLRARYTAHPERYRFSERARIVSLSSRADSLLRPFANALDAGTPVDTILARARRTPIVAVDTTHVPLDTSADTTSVYRRALHVREGGYVGPIPDQNRSLLLIRDKRLPARQKTFEEARTTLVEEYQTAVEQRLIERLRQRYRVRTFPDRLRHAFAASPHAPRPAPSVSK